MRPVTRSSSLIKQTDAVFREGVKRPPMPIRPLSHGPAGGAPYRRRTEVEDQIATTTNLSSEELERRAAVADPDDPDGLRDEVLLYHVREALRANDNARVARLWPILEQRCITYTAGRFASLDKQSALDAQEELFGTLKQLLVRDGGPGDYLEVSFRHGLKRRAIDAYNARIRHLNRSSRELRLTDDSEFDENDGSARSAHLAGGWEEADSVRQLLGESALRELTERFADDPRIVRAFVLRYQYDWPVGPREVPETLAHHFKVSDRTIRNWLSKVEEFLVEWRRRNLK